MKCLTITGLIFDIIGFTILFVDAYRVSKRLPVDGVFFPGTESKETSKKKNRVIEVSTWIGFILVISGFVLQLIPVWMAAD